MSKSTLDFKPLHDGKARVAREDKLYDIRVFQPHVFSLAINQLYSRFNNRYAINIGAGDGISCNDPVYPLYKEGYGGLAIEANRNTALAQNLPSPAIHKVLGQFVTPMNIAEMLQEYHCPECPDFFKLDIDGYDGPVLLELLKHGYRPKVMQIEINPEIPPPIEFAVLYDPRYMPWDNERRVGGFYSASLGYVCSLAARFGYRPAQVDFVTGFTHDVTLVHEKYWPVVPQIMGFDPASLSPREMFLRHPPGFSHFAEYGIDSLAWRYREDSHALAGDIWFDCARAAQVKHGHPIPFHLTIT